MISLALDPGYARLLHRDDQAITSALTMAPTELPVQFQHRAVLVGEHDGLCAPSQRRADVSGGIDAGDISRAADVAHRAAKVRLGSAEGEAVAQPADPERVLSAVEGEGARSRPSPPMTMPALMTLKLMPPPSTA